MDANKNGSVSEQEYVEAMLVILGKVCNADVPIVNLLRYNQETSSSSKINSNNLKRPRLAL